MHDLLIRGERILIDGKLQAAAVRALDGRISAVATDPEAIAALIAEAREAGAEPIDCEARVVSPGLLDVHFHGAMGHDFCDATPEALHAIAAYEASRGVTSICPATMTYPEETLDAIMREAARFSPTDRESALVGINMEGPFISPGKIGAQNPAYVQRADLAMFERLQASSGGLVRMVDVAPEEPGALEFIRAASREVRVSVAHTCATYERTLEALEAGACGLTHCYNAMPPMRHREPGPIPALIEHGPASAEIITDGHHIHPAMVRLAFREFGPKRMLLVSDSMMAAGMPDGEYTLGGQDVTVAGGVATLADGTLAGSATDLASCLKRAITLMGIEPETALRAATENPARAIGVEGHLGTIEVGKEASLVVFDGEWEVDSVILRGRLLEPEESPA